MAMLVTPLLMIGLAVLPSAATQEPDAQQQLQEKLDAKLAKSFIQKADWELEFDAAKKRAAAEAKPLFIYFSRSFAP